MQVQQMTLSFIIFVCAGLILNLPGPEKLTGKRNENSAVFIFSFLFSKEQKTFFLNRSAQFEISRCLTCSFKKEKKNRHNALKKRCAISETAVIVFSVINSVLYPPGPALVGTVRRGE